MTRRSLGRCLLVLALLPLLAGAQTLRWAGRGDVATLDPHSFNEGLTDNVLGQVYEQLARRNRQFEMEGALAERWQVVDATTWRFTLRAGVKFSDGTPLTAAEAVFSIERAQQSSSQQAYFARRLGKPTQIDERTFELKLDTPNPLLLDHQLNVRIMSAAWCREHDAAKVPDYSKREEAYSSRHAMGTGPFMVQSHQPGVRTVLDRNPTWWDRPSGNVARFVYTPIANDATRVAALLSGDVDFTQDAPPQDLPRLGREASVRLFSGPENRIIFFGLDQYRDELLYSNVKGRNPFRDLRVRQALAAAIDAGTIRSATMRGQSSVTGCLAMGAAGCLAPELENRPAADPARARALLAEAGYADGFDITLDCPNDRYVNDQAICLAVASMLGRVGIRVNVDARPKTVFFQKLERLDTSFYLVGWGGGGTDAQNILDPIVHRPDERSQKGGSNYGKSGDVELDALIDAAGSEMDTARRARLIADAQRRVAAQQFVLPLHRQMLTWAARINVTPVVMPDNGVRVPWFRVD